MVFSSPAFLFIFLTSVFILYRLIPGITAKNILLLFFSIAFYTYGEPKAVLLMLGSIILNYAAGLGMKENNKYRKIILFSAIIADLLILGIFKYAGFGAELLNKIPFLSFGIPHIALPIGISFYTFQAMSYVIDSYKEPRYIQRNPFRLALYITFFPQLIAGPIVKYYDFADQIDKRTTDPVKTAKGIRRFITGLSKKLLIANTMAFAADAVYAMEPSSLTAPLAWLGAVSYLFQIYFDFSGYSDMAIGLGSMFGFDFRENFNYPYISQSMQEFWRRWHISVSSWFKEYLYIPLGGNRKGRLRTAANKLIVFFCTGLWHGASLNFIIWGLINGMFMMLESYGLLKTNCWKRPLRHIYTLLVTIIAFVFFRADDLHSACVFIAGMFKFSSVEVNNTAFLSFLTPMYLVVFILAVIFFAPVLKYTVQKAEKHWLSAAVDITGYIVSFLLLIVCILTMSSSLYDPFIYFRF